MQNKVKNIVVTGVFICFLSFFVIMCGVKFFHPTAYSDSERRPLAQFPEKITWDGVVDKTVIDQFEKYTVDQFPFREFFRSVKANFQIYALGLSENNGLAVKDGYIAKIEPEFTPELLEYSIGRLQHVYDKYLKENGGDKFVALVPDKNYFLSEEYGYPGPDYDMLKEMVKASLGDMKYIDIFGELSLEDYYRTDTHWSQDKIDKVVKKLLTEMGAADRVKGEYTKEKLYPFHGVYYGQSALQPTPDTLTYLTNDILKDCTVFDYETGTTTPGIYDFEKFNGKDGYDFFLSGTKALLRIDNPHATTDEELIIFRDSFGSSITPLLVEGYKSVYLVDIRYIAPDWVGNFIDFQDKDVLFLYSALILNNKAFK